MNKSELIKAAAAKAEVPAAVAAKVIDAALEAAVEAVKKGEGSLVTLTSLLLRKQLARVSTRLRSRLSTSRLARLLKSNRVLNSLSNQAM